MTSTAVLTSVSALRPTALFDVGHKDHAYTSMTS